MTLEDAKKKVDMCQYHLRNLDVDITSPLRYYKINADRCNCQHDITTFIIEVGVKYLRNYQTRIHH